MKPVVIEAYNPQWVGQFERLYSLLWPAVADVALALEHVGSTSVPGLAAKPVIDLDIVARDAGGMRVVIDRLAGLGYRHRGDLGIAGREAFRAPEGPIRHHLYACLDGSAALRNHLLLRDHLRQSPEAREVYAALKYRLAAAHGTSAEAYGAGKTAFITGILARQMDPAEVEAIARANRNPDTP